MAWRRNSTFRKEIRKIEQEISDKVNPEAGTVPPTINKTLQVGTVPPRYEVVKSTRKRKLVRVRKGVEPKGENGKLWRLRRDMSAMFKKGRLQRGAVPPKPQAGDMIDKKEHLLG